MFDFSLAHSIANFGLAAGMGTIAVTLASNLFNKSTNPVAEIWDNTLKNVNKNIYNKNDETFKLFNIKENGLNYKAKCNIPNGLSFKQLEDLKPILEGALGAVIQLDYKNFSKYVNVDIITSKPNLDFKPIECPCDKLFLGYKPDGKPFLTDINENPHHLFCGMSGTGKTTLMFATLTNLLANKDQNFELYFFQLVNREMSLFSECKNVKNICNNLDEAKVMLQKLSDIADRRAETYEKANCRNISQYNKYHSRKHKRIYIVLEEFSFFRADESEDKAIIQLKQECENLILKLIKSGRANGIGILSILQRPTTHSINTTIRALVSVVTFKLKSENDSKIAVGIPGAENLGKREIMYDSQTCREFLVAPQLDEDFEILKQYVPEIKLPGDINKNHIADARQKVKENVTVLPPTTIHIKKGGVIIQDGLEIATDLSPKEDKIIGPKVKTNGKYDKDLLKFIENFKSITVKQAEIMFYKNNNNARRRLKELENQKVLRAYKYNKNTLSYTFSEFKDISEHDTIRNDFIAQLISKGSTIIDFKLTPRPLNGMIIPDLFIKYSYQNNIYTSYVEIDLTHFTSDNKITLYNKLHQKEDFNLFILRDTKPQFRILPKFDLKVLPLNKFTINV